MVCVFCQSETDVANSRSKARTPSVWRRRVCQECASQFTTLELPDYVRTLKIKSAENKKAASFSRDQLFLSLHQALSHRPDAVAAATALTYTVIGRVLRLKHLDGIYAPQEIATVTYEALKRFDPLAAHSYKAYHQQSLKR